MKVSLYLEYYHFLGGSMYKNVGTGLLSSYRNQKAILRARGIEFTERWDPSCDILQVNTPWLRSLLIMRSARKHSVPIIIWAHVTAEDVVGVFRFSKYIAPLFKRYLTHAYGQADIIFCPSAYTKTLLEAYGLSSKKLVVQSNGVDIATFKKSAEKREAYRKAHHINGPLVGTVALAIPRKGIDTFLELARTFPTVSFRWFGKIYSSLLTPSLPKVLPKNVSFTGYVDDIIGAFNAIDVFAFLSYEENQGMVLLEAAALGLPILVRDIPVYEGWLVHEENCFKARTDEEFKVALTRLLDDASLRERLGTRAQALAEAHSIERLGERTEALYHLLLEKQAARA